MKQKDRQTKYANESGKTKKVREKLLDKWAEYDAFITEDAIKKTVEKIHDWIATHSVERVSLKDKEFRLFDQNKNAALLSKKVQLLAQKISNDTHESV